MSMLSWLEQNSGVRGGNFIAGEWREAGRSAVPIFNPARKDQRLGEFANSSAGEVDEAIEAAHRAWLSWRDVPGPERGVILFRAADILDNRAEAIAYALSAEQGKVLAESRGEVGRAAKELRFSAGEASRIDGDTLPSEKRNGFALTMREPIGVIAAIAPWNFPVVTPIRKIAPALAFGCSVVFKPSNLTPWAASLLMDVFKDAGVPAGVVNLVLGMGRTVGDAMIRHPLVRGVSFTGSTTTGATINEQAARRFVRTQLELGGKNPAVVLSTSDLDAVARQIVGAAFACSGQRCTAISRVIVLESLADALVEALKAAVEAIRVGPAWDPQATMGPLITSAHCSSVTDALDRGLSEGGTVLCGGFRLREADFALGHYLAPTLIDGVQPGTHLARHELFGPVLSVIRVPTVREAFAVANDVEYGLAASIFTHDIDEALHFVRQSESGMVHVNHGTASEAHLPFGGIKGSGFGPFSIGHSNQEFFTTIKAVYLQS